MTAVDVLLRALVAWAPFHVLLTTFSAQKLGVPYVGAVKDVLLAAFVFCVAWAYLRARRLPKFGWAEWSVAAYAAWLLASSLWDGAGWRAIAVGARLDLQFFVAFLAARHAAPFLAAKPSAYLKWFLIWGGAALGLGVFVRFVTHESVLLHLGWSANLSNWTPGGAPPIWHGVAGANVRRFQGIFDGPNQAATFLLGYLAAWLAYMLPSPARRGWGLAGAAFLCGLIALTYTRSAMAAAVVAGFAMAGWYAARLWRKHRKEAFAAAGILLLVAGLFWLRYEDRLGEVFKRAGSTQGHFERMEIGWNQFKTSPITGLGLASSGPAFRQSGNPVPAEEKTFIPESWYVQQLVEGGAPALVLFCLSALAVLVAIWRSRPLLAGGFLALLGMNLLLHAFESGWAVVPFLALCGVYAARAKEPSIPSKNS